MNNFEDKVHVEGTLEKALKIHELMKKLPPSTFPSIESEIGEKIMLKSNLIKSSGGELKELTINYLKDSSEPDRRINLPSESTYIERGKSTELEFQYENNQYRIILKE